MAEVGSVMRTGSVSLLGLPGVAISVSFSFACSDLKPVESNLCGNNVVESGEACDGPSRGGANTECGRPSGAHPCAFVCGIQDVRCPSGWRCGGDGRCRLARGLFTQEAKSFAFGASDLHVADLDGDRISDLAGYGNGILSVRYGSASSGFGAGLDLTVPVPFGPFGFDDLTGEGISDLVYPFRFGAVALTGQRDRALRTVLPSLPIESSDSVLGAVSLKGYTLIQERLVLVGGASLHLYPDGPVLPLPGAIDRVPSRIPTQNLDPLLRNHAGEEFALIVGQTAYVYALEAGQEGALAFVCAETVSVPEGTSSVFFADLMGDNRPDLIAVFDGGIAVAEGQSPGLGRPRCESGSSSRYFESEATPIVARVLGALGACSSLSSLLSIQGGVAGGDLRVFTQRGPYRPLVAIRCPGADLSFVAGEVPPIWSWTGAEAGDFNRDGHTDFLSWTDQSESLFLHFGDGQGRYNAQIVPLSGAPSHVQVGDFDGDFVDDVAVVTSGPSQSGLWVSFGRPFGPFDAPTFIGAFSRVLHLEALFSQGVPDLRTDLLVLTEEGGEFRFATLFGNGSRTIVAPLVVPGSAESLQSVGSHALTGRFLVPSDGTDGRALSQKDVLLWTRSAVEDSLLWLFPSGGEEAQAPQRLVPPPGTVPTCLLSAAADVNGDGIDEVVTVNNSVGCPTIPLELRVGMISDTTNPVLLLLDFLPDNVAASQLLAEDLNGDGAVDLVVSFTGASAVGQSGVAVLWNEDGRVQRGRNSVLLSPVPGGFTQVALGPFDERNPQPELVVLSVGGGEESLDAHSEFHLVRYDRDLSTYGPLELVHHFSGRALQVVAVDADVDGLVDLAWNDGTQAHILEAQEP